MNENIIIQPAAERDLVQLTDYLSERSLDAALRFSHRVAEAFRKLASMPEMGSLREYSHPALTGIRVWRIPGFKKYLIFYRSLPDGIEVIRVLHGDGTLKDFLRISKPARRFFPCPSLPIYSTL